MKITILIVLFFVQNLFAQTETKSTSQSDDSSQEELLKSLDYPELQVVPRASERLQTEAQSERDDQILNYWPTLVPSVLNLANGLQLSGNKRPDLSPVDKDDANWAARTGLIVGAGGLALSYHLYNRKSAQNTLSELRKNQGTTKRAQLYRERLAEEYLMEQASFDRKLLWISTTLQFASNVWMIDYARDEDQAIMGIAALSSFLPVIFTQRSLVNLDNHQRAKSRIYIPISGVMLLPKDGKQVAVNSLNWGWTF